MKRGRALIPLTADMDNLRLAFWKARKGKSYAASVNIYRANLDANLLQLRQQILSGRLSVGNYRYFYIHDPKERLICAADFAEQVLHHALMNICHPYFERTQIFDSYASRKSKGTYAALERAAIFTRRYRYYLKLDIKKFFDSLHHQVINDQLARLFKDPVLLLIFNQIIENPNNGLKKD